MCQHDVQLDSEHLKLICFKSVMILMLAQDQRSLYLNISNLSVL